ncbi:hypothetical protein BZG36_03677 [Bifiguratus adelaidae]|uniref:ABM domain-containing protein n=1 Tax=Bifiguratus adelaidae TaxID=1938954 RepID=A0A261XZR3_9FUNG|nr:hypothetical protein BZG36_03677 [Bifiguratus adelaidae]
MDNRFVLAVTWHCDPNKVDQLASILTQLAQASRQEEGVLRYDPHQSLDDPTIFYIYEVYVNEAAWRKHEETDHFQSLGAKEARACVVNQKVLRLRPMLE